METVVTSKESNRIIILLFFFVCSCASPSKMGKVRVGEDGKVVEGTTTRRCEPPAKRYANNLEAFVKASVDSLAQIPSGNLEFEVKKTVTRLSDYSSEGLDIDLILFRICQMANNQGMNNLQVEKLIQASINAWNNKNKESSTIINNGINNGIMAGTVVVPVDKEIPLNSNYVARYVDSLTIELRPKHGKWVNSYIVYPLDEDSLVRGEINHPTYTLLYFRDGQMDMTLEDTTIKCRFFLLCLPLIQINHCFSSSKENLLFLFLVTLTRAHVDLT